MGTRSLSNPKIKVEMSATLRNTLTDGQVASVSSPSLSYSKTLTDGFGASQANRGWMSKSRTIASGAQETISISNMAGLDIGAGEGNDALGQAMDLEEVVAVCIVNENAVGTAGQLEIVPASSEGWTAIGSHTSDNGGALRGQGMLFKTQLDEAGFDVDPTNNHRITLRAVGGAITYSIYVLGRNDDETSSSSSSSSTSSASSSSMSTSSISASSSSISTSSASTSSNSSSASSSSSGSSSSSSESSSSLSS